MELEYTMIIETLTEIALKATGEMIAYHKGSGMDRMDELQKAHHILTYIKTDAFMRKNEIIRERLENE